MSFPSSKIRISISLPIDVMRSGILATKNLGVLIIKMNLRLNFTVPIINFAASFPFLMLI
jgi:hypothetical protein